MSGSDTRAKKKARSNSPVPVPHRNQPYSSERGRPRNSSKDPQTGFSQGQLACSPQGQRQERLEPTKYPPTQWCQDNTRGGCPATRQANTQGRLRKPFSYRRRPNQHLSEGARNLLAAIQELGTQFLQWTYTIRQSIALWGSYLLYIHIIIYYIISVVTTLSVPLLNQLTVGNTFTLKRFFSHLSCLFLFSFQN